MLWKIQLRRKIKIYVLLLLGFGALSSISTIMRLKIVIEVSMMDETDGLAAVKPLQLILEGTLYSITEIGLSIFAASLTALRPLLNKMAKLSTPRSSRRITSRNEHQPFSYDLGPMKKAAPYRLDDHCESPTQASSQENIIEPVQAKIRKTTEFGISYGRAGDEGNRAAAMGGGGTR
ncbi:hypothetical protein MN608_10205 [Microdochium nivale]|nr:hypothetical protein MN608_10205 [Microdochium nivale]